MLFGLSEGCTQLLVRGDYLIQEKIIISKGNIFGTLVMDGLIQCDCVMRSRVSQKGKKKLFNFLKIEYLLKALNIYQVLKILFWYLFYFRRYKAKSNLRVEQKARDWCHFISTSTCHLINNCHEWFTIYTLWSSEIAHSPSSLLTLVLSKGQRHCHPEKKENQFAVCIGGEILFNDSEKGSY